MYRESIFILRAINNQNWVYFYCRIIVTIYLHYFTAIFFSYSWRVPFFSFFIFIFFWPLVVDLLHNIFLAMCHHLITIGTLYRRVRRVMKIFSLLPDRVHTKKGRRVDYNLRILALIGKKSEWKIQNEIKSFFQVKVFNWVNESGNNAQKKQNKLSKFFLEIIHTDGLFRESKIWNFILHIFKHYLLFNSYGKYFFNLS